MNYKDKFEQSDKKVLNSLIATKILDLMDKLRLDPNETAQRRWIWELLQNAKDVAFEGQKVDIVIELVSNKETKSLTFKHNGQPFTVDNITFLIKQVSTKERTSSTNSTTQKNTGKFGTGFLSTHLLSEKVKVSGIVKEPDLDYRSFVLPLDRSGRNPDDIIACVKEAIAVRDTLDENEPLSEFDPNDFNTSFEYNLNEVGLNVALKGIDDLQISLPFTLVFVPKIDSVEISNQNTIFKLASIEELKPNIKLYKINRSIDTKSEIINIIKLEDNETAIAVEVELKEEKFYLKPFSESLPKIFCDFPLIGTNDFTLPFIINNSLFNPNVQRDGVYLTDLDTETIIIENKSYFRNSLALYTELLNFAIENKWENLFHLAVTQTPSAKEWFSKIWFEENIQNAIRKILVTLPIVTLEDGSRTSILDKDGTANIFFPYHSNKDVRDRIWELEFKIFPHNIPAKKDIHYWYEMVWNNCYKDTIKAITEFIQEELNLETLAKKTNEDISEALVWLNEYYDLLNFEDKFIEEIIADKYMVIPNQKGVFKKKSDLKIDSQIEEELKNVLEILGNDIRETLLHKNSHTASKYKERGNNLRQILYFKTSQDDTINEINRILETGKNTKSANAISYLLSLFSDEQSFPDHREILYNFCLDLLPSEMPPKKKIVTWSSNIWKNCDTPRIGRLITIISQTKDIRSLSNLLEMESLEDVFTWLNSFISFLNDKELMEKLNLKTSPILPNQHGRFCIKDDLFLDKGDIDESLKDILESLGYPIKEELLDKNISLVLSKSRERNAEFVANEITRLITPRFSELPRLSETRLIFKSLYLWFNKNKNEAEKLFHNLYANKHKLYDDDEIANNMSKANLLDNIMEETGLSLIQIADKLKEIKTNKDTIQINNLIMGEDQSTNGLYPFGSEEEIMISSDLTDFSSENSRISISQESQEILFQVLRDMGFTVPDSVQINFTVINGIKNPLGNTIKIVVKSAKSGKIYFNPSEWLALTDPDTQLFVLTRHNVVRNVTLNDLTLNNDIFHMRFNTQTFAVDTNLKAFANFFKNLPYTHFIFDTPESTTDYLQQFGLSERNPSSKELSNDDKNLLH